MDNVRVLLLEVAIYTQGPRGLKGPANAGRNAIRVTSVNRSYNGSVSTLSRIGQDISEIQIQKHESASYMPCKRLIKYCSNLLHLHVAACIRVSTVI